MKLISARLIAALALLCASLMPLPASAGTTGSITGTVALLKAQQPGDSFFLLTSSTRVGSCAIDGSSQRTLILFPDTDHGKQMFAMVQGALLAGKSVTA